MQNGEEIQENASSGAAFLTLLAFFEFARALPKRL